MSETESLPSDIEKQVAGVISGLVPEKLKQKYQLAYS